MNEIRAILHSARTVRAEVRRARALCPDTAVVVGACPGCQRIASAALTVHDPPYGPSIARPRYRDLNELREEIIGLFRAPPALRSAGESASDTPCACGQPQRARVVIAVRYLRAMHGTGADVVVEAIRTGADTVNFALYRAPNDGAEVPLAGPVADATLVEAFGRGLTLADAWRPLFTAARAGRAVIQPVEPGQWLFAGTPDHPPDGLAVEVLKQQPSARAFVLGRVAGVPAERAWALWAREAADEITHGSLRAGAVVDLGILTALLGQRLAHIGLALEPSQTGMVVARDGEVPVTVDVPRIALSAVQLGWTLAEAAAVASDECAQRLQGIRGFLTALRASRPAMDLRVRDTEVFAVRDGKLSPRGISLLTAPALYQPGTPEFEREVRYAFDPVPAHVDPTRVCPCGAAAGVVARLLAWTTVRALGEGTGIEGPRVLQRWPETEPSCASVVTFACDRHVRVPRVRDLEATGLTGVTLTERLRHDASVPVHGFVAELHRDEHGRTALTAAGSMLGSALMDDGLLGAFHRACGAPLGDGRSRARAVAAGTDLLCLFDPAFEPASLDRIVTAAAARRGTIPPAFLLAREARLDAPPVGRFIDTSRAPRPT